MSEKELIGILDSDGKFYECKFGDHYRICKENYLFSPSIHLGKGKEDTYYLTEPYDKKELRVWFENNKDKLNEGQRKIMERLLYSQKIE